MRHLQTFTDKLAISFSVLCAIHCLILPLLLVVLPSLTAMEFISDESFHLWMLAVVIPSSLLALTLGCRKHKYYRLLMFGLLGLVLMISAVFISEELLGESAEKIFTLIGAAIIAIGHFKNYRLCQQEYCQCPLHATD